MTKNILLIALSLLSSLAFAQQELASENEELQTALNQNLYEPNYFSLLLGLFFVIALIYLTGYVYQKLVKVNIKTTDTPINKVEIISTTSLGQGKNLHVIKLNGIYSLIGATQQSITHIKDFSIENIEKPLEEKDDK